MTTAPYPGPLPPTAVGQDDALDPVNQSLAEALRRSFGILKLLMLVLVVLYFLSGWFSIRPNEAGIVLRYGRIVGAGPGQPLSNAVLTQGWHWSWPYPFERWITVSTSEREIPVEFMFQLSDEEKATGRISGYKYNMLSPSRDDYLITGDVNILHASLLVKYKITDPASYLASVYNMPAADATSRSAPYTRYPEYSLLTNLVRDAVIETAAHQEALVIRGSKQNEFLLAVAARINEELKALEKAGAPLGITVDPNSGVLAPKSSTVEAILPPRQVQEVFDKVFSAQTEKSVTITKANSDAQERLLQTAGPDYQELADATQAEFDLLLKISAAKAIPKSELDSLQSQLAAQKTKVESLLERASGRVQGTIKKAQIDRNQFVKEVSSDWEQFRSLLPQYLKNPDIFMARLKDETYARALDNGNIAKMFVSKSGETGKIWLKIPRTTEIPENQKKPEDKGLGAGPPIKKRPSMVMP
jgi:membrane protease subunit HflK